MSSGHHMTTELTNTEHRELCLPVQEQADQPSSTEMGEAYEPTPIAEELWTIATS